MPWGRLPAEHYPASVASSKTGMPISKVRPTFTPFLSGIITKGPHLHEKPFHAIMMNPLSKLINRGEEEKNGLDIFWRDNIKREN